MQVYAFDSNKFLVDAYLANKHQDYTCIECGQTIRLRGGLHRQAHFYHIQPNRICRLHGKGMPHLMLQHFLKNVLPDGDAEIEHRFHTIGRIADVAWHSKKLVFEIQCSPIRFEEVKSRNESYASVGYQVVWIFHDQLYNQYRLSSVEVFLKNTPYYFTNMDEEGNGIIYDQFSLAANGKRLHRFPVLSIDPSNPKKLQKLGRAQWKKVPLILRSRAQGWPVIFSGDTVDSYLNFAEQSWTESQKALAAQLNEFNKGNRWGAEEDFLKTGWKRCSSFLFRMYEGFIKLLLERACR